jgi:hypothetical protein
MRKDELLRILNDWNFWRRELDTGIPREGYVKEMIDLLGTGKIVAIMGARRSGKSYLMRQVIKETSREIGAKNTLMINFEDVRIEPTVETMDMAFNLYLDVLRPAKLPFIFLDEVQRVDGWERWVRTVHELGKARIAVSGSSAKLLSRELGTLLTGRHLDIMVFPLSFKEFLKFRNFKVDAENPLDLIEKEGKIKKLLEEYLEYGGFPEVVLTGRKTEILSTYYDDITTRDVIERHRLRKPDKLRALCRYYLTNISSQHTFNSISRFLGMPVDTVARYSSYSEQAFLIFFIKRFSFSVKEQENSPRKVYAIDTGLSNFIGFRFTENPGKTMENIVAIELLRRSGDEIFYWRDTYGREVDFVAKDDLKIRQLIQVTYASGRGDIDEREIKALLKAGRELKCGDLLIITWEYEGEEEVKGKKIVFTPLWKWLLKIKTG